MCFIQNVRYTPISVYVDICFNLSYVVKREVIICNFYQTNLLYDQNFMQYRGTPEVICMVSLLKLWICLTTVCNATLLIP